MPSSDSNGVSYADLLSPYIALSAKQWSRLRESNPLDLDEADLEKLRGLNEYLSLDEVNGIFLPLSRLINLYVGAAQNLYQASDRFLGQLPAKVPFVIGIAGSVAVGKSTAARALQTTLAQWPNHPQVDLITTDGFLYPNAELERRSLMNRKGFPESYDRRRLLKFLAEVKSGVPEVSAPMYSHLIYDIVVGEKIVTRQPDILIVEGLTVLQTGLVDKEHPVFVSDYFDFSIYVDADPSDIRTWYINRFLTLRETAFRSPQSYFHTYADLSDSEARETAAEIWDSINHPNLVENILPTRERADLILRKSVNHAIDQLRLRRQ